MDYAAATSFDLSQNYPNPFNPSTTIKYTIPTVETGHASSLQLTVYNILWKEVATLVNENKPAGSYEVTFNIVEMHSNASLPSGIYFYQLKAGSFVQTKKMMIVK